MFRLIPFLILFSRAFWKRHRLKSFLLWILFNIKHRLRPDLLNVEYILIQSKRARVFKSKQLQFNEVQQSRVWLEQILLETETRIQQNSGSCWKRVRCKNVLFFILCSDPEKERKSLTSRAARF